MMSSTRKKQIPAIQRKKVTASARARVSTSRVRKATKSRLNESFIQNSPPLGVMDEPNQHNWVTTPSQPTINNQHDAMFDMLCQLTQSNQALVERVKKIEQQAANPHQTTVAGGSSTRSLPPGSYGASFIQENPSHHPSSQHLGNPSVHTQSSALSTSNNCNCSASQQNAIASNPHGASAALQRDGVVPSLENLRRLPNISQAVTNALAAYEDQVKSTLLGKQRRSGRYNTTDIAQNPPEICWPNEGYHSLTGKKGYLMTSSRWPSGLQVNLITFTA